MYRRNDPRLRRTLNQISQTVESANESAQEGLWSFSQNYITPCLAGIGSSIEACTASCFPSREERLRRNRSRRGRAEQSFDFYDDFDEDENTGLLGWGGNEESLDRLFAGSGSSSRREPRRQRALSYGTRGPTVRKSAVPPHDGGPDPTIIPNTSFFGFMGRLPWSIGSKVLRYKPSAADLQEHPGATKRPEPEDEPLLEDSEEETQARWNGRPRRNRSGTTASGHTSDSLSSRGDLFPSEDEDDAVPLDDEFTMALDRRTTRSENDETGSGRVRLGKGPSQTRLSTRTVSSRSTRESGRSRRRSSVAPLQAGDNALSTDDIPTLADLKREEDRVREEEEGEVERRRDAARKLAAQRGLNSDLPSTSPPSGMSETPFPSSPPVAHSMSSGATPSPAGERFVFPTFEMQTASETDVEIDTPKSERQDPLATSTTFTETAPDVEDEAQPSGFNPARLPHFSSSPG